MENFQKEAEVEHLRREMHEFRQSMDELIQVKSAVTTELAITKMRLELADPS